MKKLSAVPAASGYIKRRYSAFRLIGIIFGCFCLFSGVFSMLFYFAVTGSIAAMPHGIRVFEAALIAAGFLISAVNSKLARFQPFLFHIYYPLLLFQGNFYPAIVVFLFGVVLGFYYNIYKKHTKIKLAAVIVYFLFFLFIKQALYYDMQKAVFYIVFTLVVIALLLIIFRDILVRYSKPEKPVLFLADKKLSVQEQRYLVKTLEGRTFKEIAFEEKRSEEGIRSTMSRVYRKMKVTGLRELLQLAERFDFSFEPPPSGNDTSAWK